MPKNEVKVKSSSHSLSRAQPIHLSIDEKLKISFRLFRLAFSRLFSNFVFFYFRIRSMSVAVRFFVFAVFFNSWKLLNSFVLYEFHMSDDVCSCHNRNCFRCSNKKKKMKDVETMRRNEGAEREKEKNVSDFVFEMISLWHSKHTRTSSRLRRYFFMRFLISFFSHFRLFVSVVQVKFKWKSLRTS